MAQAAVPELRGWWVDTFHAGLRNATEVAQLVANARAGNFNALFVEVRKRGDAYYNSAFEPKASDVSPQSFDPLAELLRLAHDTGGGQQRLQVHAWIVTYNVWNSPAGQPPQAMHPYRLHPDWLTQDHTGAKWDGANYAFDPAHPAVQEHTFNVALDLVTRYAIDGLHFDYVRYAGREWGYHPVALERYRRTYGRTGTPLPDDLLWRQFRRDQVSALVRRVYLAAQAARPAVKVSAATITFAPGITVTAQWTSSSAYSDVLQDWRAWMQEGILDLNVPMAYFRQPRNGSDWGAWSTFAKNHRYSRHVALGAATYLNTPADSLGQLRSTRDAATLGPADGVVLYSYAAPASDGTTRAQFLHQLTDGLAGDVNPPLFAERADVPAMPWKTAPSRGHLLVQLPAADGVLVQVSGAVTRTVRTDANGWFGLVDVPLGELFCATTNAGTRWVGQTIVTAGTVAQPRFLPAAADEDGDGLPNEDELLFGTDPTEAGSRPRLAARTSPAGLHFTLQPGVPGRDYKLERRPELLGAEGWQEVARAAVSVEAAVEFPVTAADAETGFYRVVASRRP